MPMTTGFSINKLGANSRKLISGVNILIALCLGISILLFLRDLIMTYYMPRPKANPDITLKTRNEKPVFNDYAAILKNNPFGFSTGELKPITPSPVNSRQDQSGGTTDFYLIGTITGPKNGFAIFVSREGKQDVFRTGSPVFGVGKLKQIKKDKVIINIGGQDREMELVEVKDVRSEGGGQSSIVVRKDSGATTLDQRRIQQALENPQQIMTDARFLPNIVQGKQEGFRLTEVKPGGIYGSLGLQNGDVVLRINEHSISSPESALQAFTALRGMDRVQLDIIRNASKMTYTYVIR